MSRGFSKKLTKIENSFIGQAKGRGARRVPPRCRDDRRPKATGCGRGRNKNGLFLKKGLTNSTVFVIILLFLREWRNWQTRTFEGRVVLPYGFKSRFAHQTAEERLALLLFLYKRRETGLEPTGVNDSPVGCQSRRRPTRRTGAAKKSRFAHQTAEEPIGASAVFV